MDCFCDFLCFSNLIQSIRLGVSGEAVAMSWIPTQEELNRLKERWHFIKEMFAVCDTFVCFDLISIFPLLNGFKSTAWDHPFLTLSVQHVK